ncbi:hypothetical protein ACFO5R_03500 [Halosolutus amylolyticus]|uniref:Uncharacterized protein n=1 Tax=Halosolutus amylolyticus TaxID=2932267 RepID=A0ABD5PKP4_9EURY|nr:hypothetical protein [Halosolutus amylolyticus]
MIPHTVLKILIGRTWRTFVGTSHDELVDAVDRTLTDLERSYDREPTDPASGERAIFGARDATRFELADGDWALTITSVSYDPLLRAFLAIGSSGSTKSKYTNTACILDVRPISNEDEPQIRTVLQRLSEELDAEPWSIEHPRFAYSPLLRYKVKLLWRYWLSRGETADTSR